jgi:hypothetical protein
MVRGFLYRNQVAEWHRSAARKGPQVPVDRRNTGMRKAVAALAVHASPAVWSPVGTRQSELVAS